MADGTFRDGWVSEVFRNPAITDATRVMLLAIAQDMDENGLVEVSRDDLAVRLTRHPRKITDRYNAAQAAGFLEKAGGGNRSGSNVFQATFPDWNKGADGRHSSDTERVPPTGTLSDVKGAGSQHPSEAKKGATNRHPFANKSATPRHPDQAAPYKDQARAHSNADRSDENEAVVLSLFGEEKEVPPPAGAAAPAAPKGEPKTLTLEQRVNALAKTYTDLVPLSKFVAVRQIVKRAVNANQYSDQQITDGLLKLVAEKRPVTADTLRIAMEGLPSPKSGNDSRFAPGSGSPLPARDAYKTERFLR